MRTKVIELCCITTILLATGCSDYFKNDYHDNSPTSGQLKVYYDEALREHVLNHIATFESHYHNAAIEAIASGEAEAVQALYNDSCQSIVIERDLTAAEKRSFASKKQVANHSIVAYTGIAVLANNSIPVKVLTTGQLMAYLVKGTALKDSAGKDYRPQIVMDRLNSGSIHYLLDSVLKTTSLSLSPYFAGSAKEAVNYVRHTPNTLGIIDFSVISDRDDPFRKQTDSSCHLIALAGSATANYEYPDQSSFKLGTYPWRRAIYVIRKSGEFTLAKGFESFVAGPKGQITFLKQGLLPSRQAERAVQIKMEEAKNNK
jgi:phosphate transport system substrate-binding protein